MRYLSVCSGIDAVSVAWHDIYQCAAMSEIEAFPRAVLKHHYPEIPLHGDFTTIGEDDYGTIDILVGGTPCQSFSVAGLRGGLDDDRGNLALEFCRLAARKKPSWVLWENVPGCLSSNGGRDFGSILGGLAECGYGFAYRVLDAQFVRVESHPYAVPQRRRRVFVVGHLGDWRPPAAVLFERESLRRHPEPSRKAGAGNPDVSHALLASTGSKLDPTAESYVTAFTCKDYGADATVGVSPTMRSMGHNKSHANGGGQLAVAIDGNNQSVSKDVHHTLRVGRDSGDAVIAFAQNQRDELRELTAAGALASQPGVKQQSYVITGTNKTNRVAFETEVCGSLRTKPPGHQENSSTTVAAQDHMVRRLTPVECERLQGFPDGYTDILYRGKPACDGPRYKALGNSMAVNVMRWIGLRIREVDTVLTRSR